MGPRVSGIEKVLFPTLISHARQRGIECCSPRSCVTKQQVLNSWIGTLDPSGKRRTSQFKYLMIATEPLGRLCCYHGHEREWQSKQLVNTDTISYESGQES